MFAKERYHKIMALLEQKQSVTVTELRALFDVSTEFHAVQAAFMERADKVLIWADHFKFNTAALYRLPDVGATYITDKGLSPDMAEAYRQAGFRLIL